MASILLIIILMASHLSVTEEKALIVVEQQKKWEAFGDPPPQQQCVNAAIVKGETSIGLPAICFMRVDPGPCGRDLVRVYYDRRSNRCKHFSYSGCGGNANRFISIKNCYHICNPAIRHKVVGTRPPMVDEATCAALKPRRIKMNVTSVSQIQIDI